MIIRSENRPRHSDCRRVSGSKLKAKYGQVPKKIWENLAGDNSTIMNGEGEETYETIQNLLNSDG